MPVEIERVRTVARVLDHYMVDPILGLVLPGVGDLIGAVLGLYIVGVAIRRRMSPVIVSRMLMNLALDAGLGAIPIVGDIVDFAFKANEKNVALLLERHATGGRASARDWLTVSAAALTFGAVVGLVIYALVRLIQAIG